MLLHLIINNVCLRSNPKIFCLKICTSQKGHILNIEKRDIDDGFSMGAEPVLLSETLKIIHTVAGYLGKITGYLLSALFDIMTQTHPRQPVYSASIVHCE
jgi:hypothetical protein